MTLSQKGEKICFFSIFAVEAKVCDKNTHQHQVIVYFVVQKGFRSMFRNNQPFSSTQALQCTPNNSGNLWQDCSTDPISWGLSWNSSVCIITSRLELNIAQWIVDHGLPFLLDYSVSCCSLAPWLYIKNLLLWKNIQGLLQNVDFLTKS